MPGAQSPRAGSVWGPGSPQWPQRGPKEESPQSPRTGQSCTPSLASPPPLQVSCRAAAPTPRIPGGDVRPLDRAPAPPLQAGPGPATPQWKPVPLWDKPVGQASEAARRSSGLLRRPDAKARPGGTPASGYSTPVPLSAQPKLLQGPHSLPRGTSGCQSSFSCPSPLEPANRSRLLRPHLSESMTGVRSSL